MVWDTRASAEPAMKIQAHEREILAVSYSPAVDHLLLTGSADNVRAKFTFYSIIDTHRTGYRPSFSTTCALQQRSCTLSKVTLTKYYIFRGRPTIPLSLPPRPVTGGSTSGTCLKLASNRLRMTRRTVHQNLCSSTEVRMARIPMRAMNAETRFRTYRTAN